VARVHVHSETNYWTYQVSVMLYLKSALAGIVTVVVSGCLHCVDTCRSPASFVDAPARQFPLRRLPYFVAYHWYLFTRPRCGRDASSNLSRRSTLDVPQAAFALTIMA
jgi:hypothetical protein